MAVSAQEEENNPDSRSLSNAVGRVLDVDFDPAKDVTYEDLLVFTENFSEENRIGRTQFGILYRAKIPQGWRGLDHDKYVTVKMWDTRSYCPYGVHCFVSPEYLLARVKDEIRFLSLPLLQNNQNVGKVEGYCFEENKLGVIYAVKSVDSVKNIMNDKEKFGWRDRVKVARGLARFLKLCHGSTPRYIIRNLSAEHVVVDEDYNPYLVDFAMILGGDIGDGSSPDSGVPLFAYDYYDTHIALCGEWGSFTDAFTFGIVLLELIMKCASPGVIRFGKLKVHGYIEEIILPYYKKGLRETGNKELKCCFVSWHLRRHPDFDNEDGTELTMLALHCINRSPRYRLSMEEVVSKLEKLHLVHKFGINL